MAEQSRVGVTFLIKNIALPDKPRRDMGDIDELAESMQALGQLQEIVLDADCKLVAGERRLRAAAKLGWTHIRARVADNLNNAGLVLAAEYAENTQRKQLTVSEAVAQGKRVEELFQPSVDAAKKASQAKPGQKVGSKTPAAQGAVKLTSPSNLQEDANVKKTGRVKDVAAKAADMSRNTYIKAQEVTGAAEDEPELYGDIAAEMDTTGNVDAAHKEYRQRLAKLVDTVSTKGDEMTDHLGKPVPSHLRDLFGDKSFADCVKALDEAMQQFLKIKNIVKGKNERFKWLRAAETLKALELAASEAAIARGHLLECRPHAVCPICEGTGKAKECKGQEGCRQTAYLPQWRLAELKKQGTIK